MKLRRINEPNMVICLQIKPVVARWKLTWHVSSKQSNVRHQVFPNVDLCLDCYFYEQLTLLRKMQGQEIDMSLAEVHAGSSVQTPNGSYLNDGSTLERENEDLKVMSLLIRLH